MESHHASMGRNDRDRDRDRGRAALARRRSAAKRIDSFLAKLEDGSSAHADSCAGRHGSSQARRPLTHVNGTARLKTVSPSTNAHLHNLLHQDLTDLDTYTPGLLVARSRRW